MGKEFREIVPRAADEADKPQKLNALAKTEGRIANKLLKANGVIPRWQPKPQRLIHDLRDCPSSKVSLVCVPRQERRPDFLEASGGPFEASGSLAFLVNLQTSAAPQGMLFYEEGNLYFQENLRTGARAQNTEVSPLRKTH